MTTKEREVDHLQAMTGNTYEIVPCVVQRPLMDRASEGWPGAARPATEGVMKTHGSYCTCYHPLISFAGDWFPLWCELTLRMD